MSEPVLTRYARALRERSLNENARSLRRRLVLAGHRAAGETRVAVRRGYPAGRSLARALVPGVSVSDIGERVRAGKAPHFFVHPSDRPRLVAAIQRVQPDAPLLAVQAAESILRHEFDLLGSGPVVTGPDIEWHSDFTTGYRWPQDVYHARIDGRYLTGDSDIKVPWELSRSQFMPTLGRAYWYTCDERYPAEFVRLVNDWLAQNRPEAGVNWACTMDVAIRAVNWMWAYGLMADSPKVTPEFEERLIGALLEHGRFIARNLEGAPGSVNSNHYLSDIAGLFFLGILLPEIAEAGEWRSTAEEALLREMRDEVLADGADWEMSTSYHRLVTEIFLTCSILVRQNSGELPKPFLEKLSSMIDYTFHYTRPDGTVPIIGDADNSRLQRLTTWREPQREFHDHRHLLAAGAGLFGRADWAVAADGCWEEAFWLLGESAERAVASATECADGGPAGSRGFERVGVYVMRSGTICSVVNVGNEDTGGPSGHRHNDQLSFEVFAGGAFVVDPGNYAYTADPTARNAFRSGFSHNGIIVDGREANRFDPDELFYMPLESSPTVERWESDAAKDLLVARHTGYRTLPDSVLLRRSWLFDKSARLWIVWDRAEAEKVHDYLISVQFAPHTAVSSCDGASLVARVIGHKERQLELHVLKGPGFDVDLGEGWVSMSYGTRAAGPRIRFAFSGTGTVDFVWALIPGGAVMVGDAPDQMAHEGSNRADSAAKLFRDLVPDFPFGGE